jgi:hypothetical protein
MRESKVDARFAALVQTRDKPDSLCRILSFIGEMRIGVNGPAVPRDMGTGGLAFRWRA